MIAYEYPENLVTKNESGNLNGTIECRVCNKNYLWEDNLNAHATATEISIDGSKVFITLKIISKCPHCNYKMDFIKYERNDDIR